MTVLNTVAVFSVKVRMKMVSLLSLHKYPSCIFLFDLVVKENFVIPPKLNFILLGNDCHVINHNLFFDLTTKSFELIVILIYSNN